MVLYRNQLPVNFILHSAELHIGSSIIYENALYGIYFLNWYIVKRMLISFNCFSEYTLQARIPQLSFHIIVYLKLNSIMSFVL